MTEITIEGKCIAKAFLIGSLANALVNRQAVE
jgi:hypothetical protein